MKNPLRFIWIDDFPGRSSAAANLADALGVTCDFRDVKGEELGESLSKLVDGEEPSLIIIDHKLQDISDGSFKTGSSAASIIRDSWPECPIICVSGVDINDFSLAQKDIYDAIFPDGSISKHYATINSIANSFNYFKHNRPKTIDELVMLLGSSEDDNERLKSIIPSSIKENLSDKGVIRHISNWIRKILFARPGFLYEDIWAATFVGVTVDAFQRKLSIFGEAKYQGLFSDESKPRWWRSQLLSILSDNVESPGLPWEKGRSLPGLNEPDFSKCYVTEEPFPETVAYLDDTHHERHPMKLKETIQDESFQDLLYFEELRIMTPAK